ncbi:MAG: hypothetical protein HRT37_25445 [Alteromonadaceae bacterium]|nr:hypothetical protein [Alteromonadaceae bacterium]
MLQTKFGAMDENQYCNDLGYILDQLIDDQYLQASSQSLQNRQSSKYFDKKVLPIKLEQKNVNLNEACERHSLFIT